MPPSVTASLSEPSSQQHSPSDDNPGAFAPAVRAALAAYADEPAAEIAREQLRAALRAAAGVVANFTKPELAGEAGTEARRLLAEVIASGAHDAPVTPADLALARRLAAPGAGGLLGAMLLAPAWQWIEAPEFTAVPEEIIGDFAAWTFAAPQGFVTCGQADAYPARALHFMESLLRFARARPGAPAVREAVKAFLGFSCIPLYFCAESLRRHYELRAQILACATVRPAVELAPRPRAGRRLRVGFVNRHFGPQTETYSTLPTFEQLDPERFEVVLFALVAGGSPLENHARSRAAEFHVLPADPRAQVDALRAAQLDAVVFGTNVTAVFNEVTRLALHRLAPLQVVNNSSCTTTGLPEIDLYVSGTHTETAEAPAHFSERLGLLPGPAHAFNYEADRLEPAGAWTRAALGLPDDAIVFVTAANYFKIIPEMRAAWARLLAAVPGSRLLVHPFNPNWSSDYPVKRFAAECDAALQAHGVATDRLVISSMKLCSRSDVKELLRVGDIYLDTFPFGGVNSLVDPLELGLPVVAWEGRTFRSRMGGALLRELGLAELIATDEPGYLRLAKRLAGDAAWRAALKTAIDDRMGRAPVFLDPLAASEAFGALLETAFDELVTAGRAEFRRRREPVRVAAPADPAAALDAAVEKFAAGEMDDAAAPARAVLGADPANATARQLLGAVLLRTGRAVRAVDYFLGALQQHGHAAPLWHDLAAALAESGRPAQAAQALETSLRLDGSRLDGWLLLAELARGAGNDGLGREAITMAQRLAPDDPRVQAAVTAKAAKHILLYTDDPQHGGVAQYNHPVLLALARAGHRVTCVQSASDSPLIAGQRAAGIRHVWLGYDTGREFARTVNDASHAEKIFRAERPDLVVFSDCCPLSNLAARETARTLGIPYVVIVGFVGAYLAKTFASQLPRLKAQYAAARAVIAVSQENLALLRGSFGLAAGHGEVVHYGRPARFFAAGDAERRRRRRAELGLPEQAVVAFTAARLAAVKGFDLQLEAIARLQAEPAAKDLCFIWAGDGDQAAAIQQDIARRGLGGRIRLIGHQWDVAEWYEAADIFVLPSRLEGMPLAIMEAMAKGLPVIATAVSGIPEELGDTGKLLPDPARDAAGVVRGLVETLTAWAGDPALRREAGRRGRERALTMFREDLMIERTLAVIERAFAGPRSREDLGAGARQAFERGDHPAALRLAQAALKSDPQSIDALAVMGELALPRDAALAERVFRQALTLAPDRAEIAAGLGEALLAQNKRAVARDILFCSKRRGGPNLRFTLAAARWLREEGRAGEAAAVLRQAAPLAATGSDDCTRLGHAFKRCGCLAEALASYRRAAGVDAPIAPVDPAARRVRVALLVQYPQGWTSIRSVWEAFRDDARFATTIIACPNRPPNQVEGGSEAIYDFLAERGVAFTRWTEFKFAAGFADVLFIQLPYDITRPAPLHTAALLKLVPRLAYVPYALEIGGGAENINLLTNLPLHHCAWAVFARSARHKASFARHCASGDAHVIVTGHPKMDALRGVATARDAELERFAAGRKIVAWNPHYDGRADGSEWGTGYSTFLRWRHFLPEEFARRPDLALVLRPHPLFFDTLRQRRLLTPKEIDAFLARCAAAGNIHLDRGASYLPLFAGSAAMMSDASSFVLEYAATGKPLLYLHNPHGPGLNADGAFVRDYCATAQTEREIAAFLDDVAAGRDPRGDARRAAYRNEFMHLPESGAGDAIKRAVLDRLAAETAQAKLRITEFGLAPDGAEWAGR
ncbi:MAG TPA: glycosyltransferase [Opitutus sp.]|nr:glycosyltransferase [Opitutus sp.]